MNNNKSIIFIMLSVMLTLLISVSFAFWTGLVGDGQGSLNAYITIGEWRNSMIKGAFDYFEVKDNPKLIEDLEVAVIYYYDYDTNVEKYFVLDTSDLKGIIPDPSVNQGRNSLYKHVDLEWSSAVGYNRNDLVLYEGNYYVANNRNNASNYSPADGSGWDVFTVDQYSADERYRKGDFVLHENAVYIFMEYEYSCLPCAPDSDWSEILTYDSSIDYREEDIVEYAGKYYEADEQVRATRPATNSRYWDKIKINPYDNNVVYSENSVVSHDGGYFKLNKEVDWKEIEVTDYAENDNYKRNTIVLYEDIYYKSNKNVKGEMPATSDRWDEIVIHDPYDDTRTYVRNEIVKIGASYYEANRNIALTAPNLSSQYWDKIELLDSFDESKSYRRNDVLRIDENYFIATRNVASTIPFKDSDFWDEEKIDKHYDQTKKYDQGDLVMHINEKTGENKAYVFTVKEDKRNFCQPGNTNSNWNLYKSLNYDVTNFYDKYDVVIYDAGDGEKFYTAHDEGKDLKTPGDYKSNWKVANEE